MLTLQQALHEHKSDAITPNVEEVLKIKYTVHWDIKEATRFVWYRTLTPRVFVLFCLLVVFF